jgi:hypothetical protein
MRWREVLDIDEALDASEEVLARFWSTLAWPEQAPFSGGVLDAWPARLTDGLALCRSEWAAVKAAVAAEEKGDDRG